MVEERNVEVKITTADVAELLLEIPTSRQRTAGRIDDDRPAMHDDRASYAIRLTP